MSEVARLREPLRKDPGRVFLTDPVAGRSVTYGEFGRLASGLARRLRQEGVRPGDRLAACLDNSVEYAAFYFSCALLGTTAVPLNPALHAADMGFILKAAGAKRLFFSPRLEPALASLETGGLRRTILSFSPEGKGGLALSELPDDLSDWENLPASAGENIFSLMFTSGTTGRPKGVAHRLGSLVRCAAAFNTEHGVAPEDNFYHVLPMSYTAGFFNLLISPWLAGAGVVLTRGLDPRLPLEFWENCVRCGVNTFWLVPTLMAMLLKVDRDERGPRHCREKVKNVFVGTAPLTVKLRRAFEEAYGVRVWESYGLSETLFVTTNSRARPVRDGSAGYPLPGVRLRVRNESGEDLPVGQEGEIFIETPDLMAGYLEEGTGDLRPPAAPFASGDMGRIGPAGELYITDRKKDLIIRAGYNISPQAVENALLAHPAVEQVAVVGVPHELQGEEIVAAVKLRSGRGLAAELPSLEALCRDRLGVQSRPSRFVEMSDMPMGATGKIQKRAIREMLLNGALKA